MHITLRPNEKIYINGAVLRADRKVSLELMNDAVFLLEAHVMLEAHATTPLRRLYFVVQLMLMEPQTAPQRLIPFNVAGFEAAGAYVDPAIQAGLATVAELVGRRRVFEALKVIRGLLPLEDDRGAPEPVEAGPERRVAPPRASLHRPAVSAVAAVAAGAA